MWSPSGRKRVNLAQPAALARSLTPTAPREFITMPALLPMLVTGAHLVLVADKVPVLNYEPSCRAAVAAAVAPDRNVSPPARTTKSRLRRSSNMNGSKFTPAERQHCTLLSDDRRFAELRRASHLRRDEPGRRRAAGPRQDDERPDLRAETFFLPSVLLRRRAQAASAGLRLLVGGELLRLVLVGLGFLLFLRQHASDLLP